MPASDIRPDDAALARKVPLRRTPLWYPGLTLLFVITLFLSFTAGQDALPRLWQGQGLPADTVLSVLAALGFVLMCIFVWAKRYITRRFAPEAIALHDAFVRLPTSPELWRFRNVAYTDIVAVHEGGRPLARALLVESRKHLYYLPQTLFDEPLGAERFLMGLREHIMALPKGAGLIEATERRRAEARRHMTDWPLATQAVLGLSGILFANAWLKGNLTGPFGLLRWGANVPVLVAQGEWFRLLAANFLHSHWMHAVVNGLSLYYLGNLVERVLGWPRFVLIYGISGAVAMLASAQLSGAIMSVGASGAIFGLLGAFAVFSLRLRESLPLEFRQTSRWWMVMLVTNTAVPMYLPSIDIVAHLAGFVTGALVTFGLIGRRTFVPGRPSAWLLALAGMCAGLYGTALCTAVYRAATSGPEAELTFAQSLLTDKRTSASTLNGLAWLWAADTQSDDDQLAMAQRSAEAACQKAPSEAGLYLTLAVVHERRHHIDAAMDAARLALERTQAAQRSPDKADAAAPDAPRAQGELAAPGGPPADDADADDDESLEERLTTSIYAAHLAQAAISRPKAQSPVVTGWPAGALVPQTLHINHGFWTLEALGPIPKAAMVYALLYIDDTPVALVQARLAAGSAPPWRAPKSLTEEMGGASHAAIVMVTGEDAFWPPLPQPQRSLWTAWALPDTLKPIAP